MLKHDLEAVLPLCQVNGKYVLDGRALVNAGFWECGMVMPGIQGLNMLHNPNRNPSYGLTYGQE